jgi:hypothetical protein
VTPRSGWTAGQVVSVALLSLVILIILLATLVGCGSSSEPAPPPGPYDWRSVNNSLWVACAPAGDRLYGAFGGDGSITLTVVPAGCAAEPRS